MYNSTNHCKSSQIIDCIISYTVSGVYDLSDLLNQPKFLQIPKTDKTISTIGQKKKANTSNFPLWCASSAEPYSDSF
jgi:hypothetical protein